VCFDAWKPPARSIPYEVINSSHSPRATAALAADSLDDLLAVVVNGAKEHPSRKTVETTSSLLAALLLLVGRGVLRWLR
jgi:hypothetical protein